MKTLSKRMVNCKVQSAIIKQLEEEANKQLEKEREKIAYSAVAYTATTAMRRTEATLLYVLSRHGYGEKRLRKFHDWFMAFANTPARKLGETALALDCEKFMRETYGINFDEVKLNVPDFDSNDEEVSV